MLKLPALFWDVHQYEIQHNFHKYGPIFRLVPKEPLGRVTVTIDAKDMPDLSICCITIRCINERGIIRVEAFSEEDLVAAEAWAKKHRNTPLEDFNWCPSSAS